VVRELSLLLVTLSPSKLLHPPPSPFNSILERVASLFSFFLSPFFATPPNAFFQIQAYLSLVSTGGFAIFANRRPLTSPCTNHVERI
jgi:hypothetical protein